MATSYGPQIPQVNPCDENPEPQEMRTGLEVDPSRAWYYHISPNFYTLVMNLKLSLKVVTKLKTLLSSHGLQFLVLDIIVGCAI
jgi:hypothetical protein